MRTEKDTMGKVKVPDDVYFGAQTRRAQMNFPISGLRLPGSFIRAQGILKLAAVRVNTGLGLIKKRMHRAVERASLEVIKGKHDSQFVVDVYQAGAGTSQNMNANEVIANRAIELLGGVRGDYDVVSPNDHVNMSQSTNDTFPSAIYISAYGYVKDHLVPALNALVQSLEVKSKEFDSVIKSGRTHLQDAVPIRLGQEFSGYAKAVDNDICRILNASLSLLKLPIGGNAVGTGVNAHPKFKNSVIREIRKITGVKFVSCGNMFEGIQNVNPALEMSASLRGTAVTLIKIANDFRLMSSGPSTGFAEIKLPAVQPGSSIMPGKVNPVMAEMLNMVCFQVIGNDSAIACATQAAQLELNVMMPVIAHNLLSSLEILTNGINAFNEKCVQGVRADVKQCKDHAEATLGVATALNPIIGYEAAAEISHEAYSKGKTVKALVVEKGILTEKEAGRLLDPGRLTSK